MKRLIFACAVAALGVGLGIQANAFAYGPSGPTISISTSTVGPGGSLIMNGSGFCPLCSITFTLHSNPVVIGTTTANASGDFSATLTIPSNTAPGTHTIVATDPDGDTASTTITVTGATVPVSTVTPSKGLAFTGADIAALSGVGAIALGLGGMLLLTSRRRRSIS